MTDWTAGYVADIGYTYGYYNELNPLRARLALLNAGYKCPDFGTACELGFGQGISANFHAAGSDTSWYGTDFNPAQAGFAQELAEAAGTGARLFDSSFEEFATREDLPDFDYIGLHGIWSWISDENRKIIVEFVRRKLKVGGVLYISYNTLPGWAAFAPMRHLMTEHASIIGSEGHGIVSRIDGALGFAEKFLATNPLFSRANPLVGERIKNIATQNRHYLAHEYFNKDWHPMHFATMANWLEPAKVQYACSAHFLDYVDAVNLTNEQLAFLKEIPDAMFRESVRDFMVNQQFRRDYWVKGARKLNPLDQAEALRSQGVILLTHRADVSLKVKGARGEADMNENVYRPILDFLADHKPRTIDQIEQAVKGKGITSAQTLQAVVVLIGGAHIAQVQATAVVAKARSYTDKLNIYLLNKARANNEISYLVSPVTGAGVNIDRLHQLFLLAFKQGQTELPGWVEFALQILESQGQKLMKEGKPVEAKEDSIAILMAEAKIFSDKKLPLLKALQIA
jgi:SAM-dependent methyltransferase